MWISGAMIVFSWEAFVATHNWLWGHFGSIWTWFTTSIPGFFESPEQPLWLKGVVVALYLLAGYWSTIHSERDEHPLVGFNLVTDRVVWTLFWLPGFATLIALMVAVMFYMIWLIFGMMAGMFAFMIVIFEAPIRWIFGL